MPVAPSWSDLHVLIVNLIGDANPSEIGKRLMSGEMDRENAERADAKVQAVLSGDRDPSTTD